MIGMLLTMLVVLVGVLLVATGVTLIFRYLTTWSGVIALLYVLGGGLVLIIGLTLIAWGFTVPF